MQHQTDDVRISEIKELLPPVAVLEKFPATETASNTVFESRQAIHQILAGEDQRLLVVIGPCSIHDPVAALEYGKRLKTLRDELKGQLEIVMRVYFEKPRTTVGWKGLINDPYLDNTCKINDGLRIGRKLLLDLNDMGLPTASEFLDMITPQYVADLMSWGAIGARTTESQVHRELASGLSCPVGFKNGTDGTIKVAIDAIGAASAPHYSAAHVDEVVKGLDKAGLPQKVMIDFSHANSSKQFKNQMLVAEDVAGQLRAGSKAVFGVMVESHLVEGCELTVGQSITDACIGWADTEVLLRNLADAVATRNAG
ncbi:Phospho-2-dehydro-3-deoxyheptonate aldolase, Phe-sensitive [Aeromonas salmonicida]|uniref:3-deoxy-7-phosphoheptulonate synthase n=1 Tax=Aeromonas salmonicida TaxID=645 RepID=UPI00366D13EE